MNDFLIAFWICAVLTAGFLRSHVILCKKIREQDPKLAHDLGIAHQSFGFKSSKLTFYYLVPGRKIASIPFGIQRFHQFILYAVCITNIIAFALFIRIFLSAVK